MSWSASCPGYRPEKGAQLSASDFAVSPPYDALHDEPREQFDQALGAVERIIESGVVGAAGDHEFVVTMSGHANPDHERAGAYTDDWVSLQVTQKREPTPVDLDRVAGPDE